MTKAYSYIRMSTDKQRKGDSLRRQTQASEEFAQQHGLTLDDTFKLRDIGLSAYDGSNIEKGQLGIFLHAVKTGKIESGSYLVVESFDRISRLPVMDAFKIFMDLLDHDIKIATLIDGRLFTRNTTDHLQLIATLTHMERANEESRTKSHRGREVWQTKRDNAHKKKLTKRCPGWLKLRHDGTCFEPIPDRVVIVRRVFNEAADLGMGADLIARRLNREKVPTFGRSKGWHKSYVLKILGSRAVLGEFQPRTTRGDIQIEPKTDYFPAVIEPELFYRAQAARERRHQGGGGRKGEKISNLFSGIARCGVCGGPMGFIDRGKKGGRSLRCNQAKREAGCYVGVEWKYDDFETSFFAFIRETNLPKVMGAIKPDHDRAKLEDEIRATEGRLIEAEKRRGRAFELYTDSDQPTDFMRSQFRELEDSVEAFKGELDNLKRRLTSLDREEAAFNESREGIMDLVARLQKEDGDDLVPMRSAVAERLQNIVDEIRVWPGGMPRSSEVENAMRQMYPEKPIAELKEYLPVPEKNRRAFAVIFKDGTFRVVSPTLKDPMQFRYVGATNESLITDRDVLAWCGVDDPTPEQYQQALDELRRDPENLKVLDTLREATTRNSKAGASSRE